MQCENCPRAAEYEVHSYRFCLTCARRFLGYAPPDESKIPAVSLPIQAEHEPAPLEETQAGLLERATRELDELRTALEQQSTALARLQTAHLELRAAYDQRGKAIESATTAANRFNKALWAAVEKLGEGEVLEAERVMKGALE